MSTYLRLLYIAFWMQPLQSYFTVIGLGLMAGFGATLYSPTPVAAWLAGWGFFIAMASPLLLGGAFWRALSAPRAVSLAPRGRLRFLLSVLAIAVTIPLSAFVFSWLYSLGMPGTGIAGRIRGIYWLIDVFRPALVVPLLVAPWIALWLIACFVVSRSPLATLLVLITCILCVYGLWRFDFMDPKSPRSQLLEDWGFMIPLAATVLFAVWYLLARRIRPPGWLLPGGQSLLAAVALAEPATRILRRHTALERLLLGGSSVSRLLVQWLLVYGLLLLLLMPMALQGEDQARIVAHFAFIALLMFPAIVAAQALAIVRRARVLWLASGFSRPQLYAFIRRTLLKFTLGMVMLFAALLLLLWNTQPWHPALTAVQVLALCLLPGLFAAACALCRPGGQMIYWPAVAVMLWFVAWPPLTASDRFVWIDGFGMAWNASAATATATIIILLLLAPRRWQAEDLPRAPTSR